MKKNYFLTILSLLFCAAIQAQVTFNGNGNSGFGGPVGSSTLSFNDDGTTITGTFTKGAGDFNDRMVIYISNGTNGRKIIDGSVNDQQDPLRSAISNRNSLDLTFPPGFEATHAIGINIGFGGLWSIADSGTINNNELGFITAVGAPTANTDASFTFSFTWANLGLTNTDNFSFVVTYGNPDGEGGTTMFSSDEAYGGGIASGNPGAAAMTYTQYFDYPSGDTGGKAISQADGSWTTVATWANGNLPLEFDEVTIDHNVTIDANGVVGDLIINNGKSLTINANQSISTQNYVGETTGGNIVILDNTADDAFFAESGSSLIVEGSLTGILNYTRNLATNNFYLISSPVNGVAVQTFMADHVLASGVVNSNNRGLGTYNNNGTGWSYYDVNYSGADGLDDGKGFAVKLTTSGDITFTGTVPATTDVDIPMDIEGPGVDENRFNLMGNPYPAYIPANAAADATNNILQINDVNNNNLSEATIWFWDAATEDYVTVTLNSPTARYIDPAQGFFVKSEGNNNLRFNQNMRSHQTANSFQKTQSVAKMITLNVNNGSKNKSTELYFDENATTDFDNGYDGSLLNLQGNGNAGFAVFTGQLTNDAGKKLSIQALPDSDYENNVIPVGLRAEAGNEITFTAEALNIPAGLKVFLEDRNTNTFTRLDELNSNYKVTLTETTNGIGRFYLHTKSSALSTETVALENVSIYSADKANLRIVGLSQGKSTIKMFNVLGKQVLNATFNSNGVSEINVSHLSTGIYIVQLENEAGSLNKKVVLE